MGAIKELYFEIETLLETTDYSLAQIAKELNVSVDLVTEISKELSQQQTQDECYVS